MGFGAVLSSAHMFACLRFNHPVARMTARLASGLPGSALAGRGSHPLDDYSEFRIGTTSFRPIGPALPDRFLHFP